MPDENPIPPSSAVVDAIVESLRKRRDEIATERANCRTRSHRRRLAFVVVAVLAVAITGVLVAFVLGARSGMLLNAAD